MLTPASCSLRTVAATTWAEYKKYFEKDPALTRRFQVVQVDEPALPAVLAGRVPAVDPGPGRAPTPPAKG